MAKVKFLASDCDQAVTTQAPSMRPKFCTAARRAFSKVVEPRDKHNLPVFRVRNDSNIELIRIVEPLRLKLAVGFGADDRHKLAIRIMGSQCRIEIGRGGRPANASS